MGINPIGPSNYWVLTKNPFNLIYPQKQYTLIQHSPSKKKKKTSTQSLKRFRVSRGFSFSLIFSAFNHVLVVNLMASTASKLRTHQNSSKLHQISELFTKIFTLSLFGHSSTHRVSFESRIWFLSLVTQKSSFAFLRFLYYQTIYIF